MLKFLLEQTGASVVAADSVPPALDEFKLERPDVVVADIAMPGLNGYALIAEVRRLDAERGEHTRAIAVTAFSTQQDQALATASGFDAYITKPFDPDALVRTIVKLLLQ
jgi:CheY-like chemotaxis protein